MYNKNMSYLHDMLTNIFKDNNYSICIQDTSGVLHTIPELYVDYKFRVHTGSICTVSKQTTTGLNLCSRMKVFSLNRFKENDKAFVSRCHLGIYEIAKPVFHGNKLACAIYIGSFIMEGSKSKVINQIKKYSDLTGTRYEDFLEAMEKTPEIKTHELQNILNLAESIALYIKLLIEKSGIILSETNKKNRLNKSTSEGIHWAVAFAMEYVDMHYRRDIQLYRIARMLFFNPDYLSRLFHKETGKNFIDYLNHRRIFEARRIIEQSKANITTICYDVGFKNKPHFNRMFKRLCAVTPMEYKKLYRKNIGEVKHNPSNV